MDDTSTKNLGYIDTRGQTEEPLTYTETIIKGIAPSGGLYVPTSLPRITPKWLSSFAELNYPERAAVMYRLFGVDVPSDKINELMQEAYSSFSDQRIAPLTKVTDDTYILELFHGPTSAFKDMALQNLPRFLSYALEKHGGDLLILVATSGDTGTAALNGFAHRDHIKIAVLYPHGGVSDIQYRQMVTQEGDNVNVLAARGNFDDCQTTVKQIFADQGFADQLYDEDGSRLSSANSINWGRLMPQIVYYLSAYADLVDSGRIVAGEYVDVCVPTGNFGNILAAYYAQQMGCPIERLYCASNENNVLTDFINTGIYDIRDRTFMRTPSPSMDILISSNLERLLFELTDRDGEQVRTWMNELRENKVFQIDKETFKKLRQIFSSDFVDASDSLATIGRVWREHQLVLDPHTSVAFEVAERLHGENPVIIASTAHYAKFGDDVYRGLHGFAPGEPLPEDVADLNGVELAELISQQTNGKPIPPQIARLADAEVRFTRIVNPEVEEVELALLEDL